MTRFVWAESRHEGAIVSLWKQGFPDDTEEDIQEFLTSLRGEARCFLLEQDGEARSMAFVIPATLMYKGESRPVWYIYAAVTAVEHRGQGLFGRLLEEIACVARVEGVWGMFLRPANSSLFTYYTRLGFTTAFSVEHFEYKAKNLYSDDEELTWQKVTSHHGVCREYWLSVCGTPYIRWSDRVTNYAVELLENGGMVVSTKGMVMYHRKKDRLYVTELLCKPQDREMVLMSLARHFTCRKIAVVTPSFAPKGGHPYGMFRAVEANDITDSDWYMGFSLE